MTRRERHNKGINRSANSAASLAVGFPPRFARRRPVMSGVRHAQDEYEDRCLTLVRAPDDRSLC